MEKEQAVRILQTLTDNALTIPGITLGLFGSYRYGSPLPPDSDYDLMIIITNRKAIPELAGLTFMERLFGEGASSSESMGPPLSPFLASDLEDMLEGNVDILQAGGSINVSAWLPDCKGIPPTIDVEFYAVPLDNLISICVTEPGGELRQRYNSKPTRKSLQDYNFQTTSGIRVDYNQRIELIGEGGDVSYLRDGSPGNYTLEQAIENFDRYQKFSPGLPRVNPQTEEYEDDISFPLMIGTTGDKVLSLVMLSDPGGEVANELLVPVWKRVARDFNQKWPEDLADKQFAALFQRYNMGRFSKPFIERVDELYKRALDESLEAADLYFDFAKYEIWDSTK